MNKLFALLALSALSSPALAHPGHGADLAAGLAHPFGGADHLLAMLAVGLWTSLQLERSARAPVSWLWPTAFVAAMLAGALAGVAGFVLPVVEPAIALSVLALGLLVALRAQWPAAAGVVLVAAFAVCHGQAHAAELPAGANAAAFLAGMAASTALLHMAGIMGGRLLRHRNAWLLRIIGGGMAVAGVLLLG